MSYQTILFDREEPLAIITLNRPDRLNAFNDVLVKELLDVVQACSKDSAIRALLITGAGRAFCSGGDQKREQTGVSLVDLLRDLILSLRELPKPVVAAVNGPAMGAGFNLALACDFRIAAETARFSAAFVKIGLSTDSAGSYWLPRFVGIGKATELIMTGDTIDAREAERLGLVNKVVPVEQLATVAREMATRLANGPTLALGRAKMLLNSSLQNNLGQQLDIEGELLSLSYQTADYTEGRAAFQEKRQPQFKGS